MRCANCGRTVERLDEHYSYFSPGYTCAPVPTAWAGEAMEIVEELAECDVIDDYDVVEDLIRRAQTLVRR